jgi:hypothetical protein
MINILVNTFPVTGHNYCIAVLDKMGFTIERLIDPDLLKNDIYQVTILKNPYDAIVDAMYTNYTDHYGLEVCDITDRQKMSDLLRKYIQMYEKYVTFPIHESKLMLAKYEDVIEDPELFARKVAAFFNVDIKESVYDGLARKKLYKTLEHHVEGTGNHLKNVGGHSMAFKSNWDLEEKSRVQKEILAKLSESVRIKKRMRELNDMYLARLELAQ